jgi:hypothetical protein
MEYVADTVAIIRYFSQTGNIGKTTRQILDDTLVKIPIDLEF